MDGTVLATLGEGRFGKVQCIRRSDSSGSGDNGVVAVKSYDRQKAADMGRVARILQEKAVLQLLNNPYITRYIDTAKDDSSLYIIMEAVLGGPLHRHIALQNGLSLSTVQVYLAQLISCCDHLARRGCIHRDIKASNCVLDAKGHIKLCDFGCSKILYPSTDFKTVVTAEPSSGPRTMTFLGSHHAMPVEVLTGNGYGISVDWWALGILLYEMITGTPPFDNAKHLVQENPSSTLDSYDWTINFDSVQPFSSLNASSETSCRGLSSSQRKILSASKQLISELLHPDINQRSGIWNIYQIKNSDFMSDIDFSFIDQGICSPVAFDKRVGFLEIINNDNSDAKDVVTDQEQLLFDDF